MSSLRIPSIRLSPDRNTVSEQLGLLRDLAGSWAGRGFNLIARPDKEGGGPLFLELNQTHETLKIDTISSSIPNRGFAQDDIELFGLTYLQKISDTTTGGALHIEPGIWVTQPATTAPRRRRLLGRKSSPAWLLSRTAMLCWRKVQQSQSHLWRAAHSR
jgi:hypothetical protein